MNKNILNARFDDFINVLSLQYGFTVNDNLITFNRNYLSSIFIYKIFHPCFQNTSGEFTSDTFFQIGLINLYLFSQIENFKNIFIILKTNCP